MNPLRWWRKRQTQRMVSEYLLMASIQIEQMKHYVRLGEMSQEHYVMWRQGFLERLGIPEGALP